MLAEGPLSGSGTPPFLQVLTWQLALWGLLLGHWSQSQRVRTHGLITSQKSYLLKLPLLWLGCQHMNLGYTNIQAIASHFLHSDCLGLSNTHKLNIILYTISLENSIRKIISLLYLILWKKKVSLTRNLPNAHPHNHHLPSGVPGVASPEFRKHDPLVKGVIHCENESKIIPQGLKCTGWASTGSIRVGLGTQWEIIACFYQVLSLGRKTATFYLWLLTLQIMWGEDGLRY